MTVFYQPPLKITITTVIARTRSGRGNLFANPGAYSTPLASQQIASSFLLAMTVFYQPPLKITITTVIARTRSSRGNPFANPGAYSSRVGFHIRFLLMPTTGKKSFPYTTNTFPGKFFNID
jgi:hypothetical protein